MTDQASDRPRRPLERGWVKRKLIRELAHDEKTQRALADEYGVAQSSIAEFKARHLAEIEAVRADLEDEFAGLWIAKKAARLAEYEADVDRLNESLETLLSADALLREAEVDPADAAVAARILKEAGIDITRIDPAVLTAKHRALRAAADELGQIPNRVTVESTTKVRYLVEGVDDEKLT